MSRKQQPEACGVWLDVAQLKKRKRQTLLIGPTSKLLSPFLRRNVSAPSACEFSQTKAIRPCIRQTTISSFFIPKAAGKENDRQRVHVAQSSPAVTWKNNKRKADGSWKEPCSKRSSARSFQGTTEGEKLCSGSETAKTQAWDYNLVSQSRQGQRGDFDLASTCKENQTQGNKLFPKPHKLTEQSMFLESSYEMLSNAAEDQPCALQEYNSMEGDYGSQFNFTQDSEGNHVIAHRSNHASVNLNSEFIRNTKIITAEISSPNTKNCERHVESSGSDLKICHQLHCDTILRDKWDLENSDPTERDLHSAGKQRSACKAESLQCQQKSSRLPWGRQSPANTTFDSESTRHVEEQTVSASQLFTQDSQGHLVISHRYLQSNPGQKALPLHDRTNQLQRDKSGVKAPLSRGSCGIFSQAALVNPQALDLQSQYSLLFTQDSEGNTVIKHVDQGTDPVT